MTVHLSTAREEDSDAWNTFVASDPAGHILQSHQWGALKACFGWQPLRFTVQDGERIAGGAQVLFRRLRHLGVLPRPDVSIAYIPRGPVVDPADEDALAALLSAIHQAARRAGAIFLKIEPNWTDDPSLRRLLVRHGFQPSVQTVQPRCTLLIDLQRSEEELLMAMKSKTRYNIRLAARKGVVVREGTEEDLDAFYRLLQETRQRDAFAIHTRGYYDLAWQTFAPADKVRLFIASYEDRVLGAIMVFAFGRIATYMYGASSDQHRNRMPTYLLQWEAMRWARDRGCHTYDLWGVPDEDEEVLESQFLERSDGLWGVYRFKRGFGGRVMRYVGAYDYVYRPRLYWLWTRAVPGLRAYLS